MQTILTVFFSFLAGAVTLWGLLEWHTRSALHRLARAEREAYEGLRSIRWEQAIEDLERSSSPRHALEES